MSRVVRRLVVTRIWRNVVSASDLFTWTDFAGGKNFRAASDSFTIYDAATHS